MSEWQVQKPDKPLYPDVIWSRPENLGGAGKLLIIGGSPGKLANLSLSYSQANNAGAGMVRLLVPDSLSKITKHIPGIEYAPSNPSGGLAKASLGEILNIASQTDGVLLAGDIGRNSETAMMLESLLTKYQDWLVIDQGATESFAISISELASRPKTILCMDFTHLRSLAIETKSEIALTSDISLANLAKLLHQVSQKYQAILLVSIFDNVWVAKNGLVTQCQNPNYNSAKTAVWLIGQPEKAYQSAVCSVT